MKTQFFQVNTLKELFEFFVLDNINTDSKTTKAFFNSRSVYFCCCCCGSITLLKTPAGVQLREKLCTQQCHFFAAVQSHYRSGWDKNTKNVWCLKN